MAEAYRLEALVDGFTDDPDDIAYGCVVGWGEEAVGGRNYMQLKGYTDPIIAVQIIEGARADDGYVWIVFRDEDGSYPTTPRLADLSIVRGQDILGAAVRLYDGGVGSPAGSRGTPAPGPADPADGGGPVISADSAVDAGVYRDDAAATVRAFNSL